MARKRPSWNVIRNYGFTQVNSENQESTRITVREGQILEIGETFEFGKYIPKIFAEILVQKEILAPITDTPNE